MSWRGSPQAYLPLRASQMPPFSPHMARSHEWATCPRVATEDVDDQGPAGPAAANTLLTADRQRDRTTPDDDTVRSQFEHTTAPSATTSDGSEPGRQDS